VKITIDRIILVVAVVVLAFWSIFPVYWMIVTSFKGPEEIFAPSLIPQKPSIENYYLIFYQIHDKASEFWIQLFNSFLVAIGNTGFVLLVSVFAAYATARFRFRGAGLVARLTLITYVIPSAFLVVPFFILIASYGLIDEIISVVMATTAFSSPFAIWVLRDYFMSIPKEIEEAALVDGANRLRVFVSIALPLAAPALVAMATYAFIYGWNEYLYVFVLISSTSKMTLPISMGGMLTSDDVPWGVLSAMATVYSIPPVVFYYLISRYVVLGLVRGAVKV